ncbi:MAG: hypothetical protein JWN14_169, partial [Chthonomonadales bacterium]|nr:hypothetical protein [Chthonomonadales bacterium]
QNFRGIDIRVLLETAVTTTEICLAGSIRAFGMSASTALLRGILCIDFDEWYACSLAFVCQEEFELLECPVVEFGSHRPIQTVSSLPYAIKHFQSECLLSVKCHVHQGFGDAVVDVSNKAGFFPASLGHTLPCRAGFLGLEFLTQSTILLTNLADGFTGITVAFAVGGNVDDAEINTDHAFRSEALGFCHRDSYTEVKLSVAQEELLLVLVFHAAVLFEQGSSGKGVSLCLPRY